MESFNTAIQDINSPINSLVWGWPTVILIAVVFLIVLKDAVGWIWGVAGILGLALILTVAIKRYQRMRGKGSGDADGAA